MSLTLCPNCRLPVNASLLQCPQCTAPMAAPTMATAAGRGVPVAAAIALFATVAVLARRRTA